MTLPKVSVICIAKDEGELVEKERQLAAQSFRDFEFVGVAGGTIPEAWNRGIERARGEILVFTETDATPVTDRWLAELVAAVTDGRSLVKGLEVTGLPYDLSNLACHRSVLEGNRFREDFRWAEDSELFCRLKQLGYELRHVQAAPVIHLRKMGSKRRIRRAFRYGLYQAKLRYLYGDRDMVSGGELALKVLLQAGLSLLGLTVGYIVYWPLRLRRAGKSATSTR
jgi:GT2 family glycosyltransferase